MPAGGNKTAFAEERPEPGIGPHESLDDIGVELGACAGLELLYCMGMGSAVPIGPGGSDGIIGVGHADDPGEKGDLLALQPVRIPGTVEVFVVMSYGRQDGVKLFERAQDLAALLRM